jgi:hypothetical protein
MKVEALTDLAEVFGRTGHEGAAWALAEARKLAAFKGNTAAIASLGHLARRLDTQPARAR